MKKLIPFMVICITLFLTSCVQESHLEVNESSELTTISNTQTRPPGGVGGGINPCCGEENIFERQLHWFSYLAVEISTYNAAARWEMKNLLTANGGISIPAEDLIGNQNLAPVFNAAFYERLVWYYDEWTGWPAETGTNPPFPPGTGGTPGNTPGSILANQYYDILLNNNCLELYYPNGLDVVVARPSFSTTAHPLTRSGANEGIQFIYSAIIHQYRWTNVVVDDAYVLTNENTVVARPIRTLATPVPGLDCTYSEYDFIDFTNFLD